MQGIPSLRGYRLEYSKPGKTGSYGDTLKWSQLRGGHFNETLYVWKNIYIFGQNWS